MEEGALRVDANVSLHIPGEPFGQRTELKNLNSFKSLGRGIESEIERQAELIATGRQVQPETRSYEQKTRKTFAMRDKESVADYRFLPEPNLPPLHIYSNQSEAIDSQLNCVSIDQCQPSKSVLPEENRKYLLDECQLSLEQTFRFVWFVSKLHKTKEIGF